MTTTFTPADVSLELRILALESNFVSNMVDSFKNTFVTLVEKTTSSFSLAKSIALPTEHPITSITKQQNFVLKGIENIQYLDLAEITVIIPEHFNGNYVSYSVALIDSLHQLKTITTDVLKPFNIYLKQFLSSKEARLSSKSLESHYKNLAYKREHLIEKLDIFRKVNVPTSSKLGKLINRKQDINTLYHNVNKLGTMLTQSDLHSIQGVVKESSDILNMIITQVEKDEITHVSPEVIMSLAHGVNEVAKEIECLAMVSFRANSLVGCVDDISTVLTRRIMGQD
jgi:hypothetical protein